MSREYLDQQTRPDADDTQAAAKLQNDHNHQELTGEELELVAGGQVDPDWGRKPVDKPPTTYSFTFRQRTKPSCSHTGPVH